jgi:hypothetical protein
MQQNNRERIEVDNKPLTAREDQEKDQDVQDGLSLIIKILLLAILIIVVNRLIT